MWTDTDRDEMIALRRYEAGVGPCGFHHSLTNDPDFHAKVEDEFCQFCADLAVIARVQAAADQEAEKRLGEEPDPKAKRPDDGRRQFIRLMTPAEIEQKKARQQSEAQERRRPTGP